MKTVLRIAHSLSASLSLSKMIKISGRTSSSDSFVTKFTTISKKNELIARARRRLGFVASDIRDAWHTYRKSSLFERSTKAEQHARLVKWLETAGTYGCREVTYFRATDGVPSCRYNFRHSMLLCVGG